MFVPAIFVFLFLGLFQVVPAILGFVPGTESPAYLFYSQMFIFPMLLLPLVLLCFAAFFFYLRRRAHWLAGAGFIAAVLSGALWACFWAIGLLMVFTIGGVD